MIRVACSCAQPYHRNSRTIPSNKEPAKILRVALTVTRCTYKHVIAFLNGTIFGPDTVHLNAYLRRISDPASHACLADVLYVPANV